MQRLTQSMRATMLRVESAGESGVTPLEVADCIGRRSSAYASLRTLTEVGFVNRRWAFPDDDMQSRPMLVYSITDAGLDLVDLIRADKASAEAWRLLLPPRAEG